MTTDFDIAQRSLLEPDFEGGVHSMFGGGPVPQFGVAGTEDDEPLRPINWNLLSGDEAEAEWLDLNAWVNWLRATYGLPPTVIPPYWHRHDELVWELSALHLHWLNSYDSEGSPSGPIAWHRDFNDERNRLREWVSTSGTRLDRDRATRQTAWPGEPPIQPAPEVVIDDRDADFVQVVLDDVAARREIEERVRAAS
jgi:hypothetical protein